jgi:hypothetical protein
MKPPSSYRYESWRHGGWYVMNVRYPSGACGCVSRNFPDRRWRIVCDPRTDGRDYTYRTRDDAARAEWLIAESMRQGAPWFPPEPIDLRYMTSAPVLPA